MPDDITQSIALELGIGDLSAEEQQALIAQFGEVALKAATMSIVEKMNEADRDEFVRLAQAGDAGAIRTFLDSKVANHEEIAKAAVAEEVMRFKAFQAENAG